MCFCFFKQKTAYEMRISDWSSDVCSSDLVVAGKRGAQRLRLRRERGRIGAGQRHQQQARARALAEFIDEQFLLRGFGGGHELAQVPGQLQVRADPPAGEQQRCQPQQGEGDARAGIHADDPAKPLQGTAGSSFLQAARAASTRWTRPVVFWAGMTLRRSPVNCRYALIPNPSSRSHPTPRTAKEQSKQAPLTRKK